MKYENKYFRERMLFLGLDDDNPELRTEHPVLCDDKNFRSNEIDESLNTSTSTRNVTDIRKRTS